MQAFGDSHIQYLLSGNGFYNNFPEFKKYKVDVNKYRAASALGLSRNNSKLQVGDNIKEKLTSRDVCIFGFGQVDVELGYYYKRLYRNYALSHFDFCQQVVDSYVEFLKSIDSKVDIVVKGINYSVLNSEAHAVKYISRIISADDVNKNSMLERLKCEVKSINERNNIHQFFNDLLKTEAEKNSWLYFDVNSDIIDDKTCKVRDEYVPGGFDHHLVNSMKVKYFHYNKLKILFDSAL